MLAIPYPSIKLTEKAFRLFLSLVNSGPAQADTRNTRLTHRLANRSVMPAETEEIPEIDMSQQSEAVVAEQLVSALTTVGFCYAVGHGVPQETVASAFAESAGFFERPLSEKLRHRRDWRKSTCGYIPPHWASTGDPDEPPVERFSLDAPPDEKEALDVCHTCDDTVWPSKSFRKASLDLISAAQLADAFAGFATPGNTSELRMLHYPPLPPVTDGTVCGDRCGEHTDYGIITLVFCDSQPGLQVLSRSARYLDANPRPGRVLVNIGDLMQRWTGGRLHSARHRVLAPTDPKLRSQPRYSLVYFTQCDDEYIVRPLLGDPDSFPPVKTGHRPAAAAALTRAETNDGNAALADAFVGFPTPANTSQLRMLHYPPLSTDTNGSASGDRCGEHTDYGCITLVFCDSQPGLQRWTGGRLHSARHRVLAPTDPKLRSQPRYSLVYFTHCDDDFTVRPRPGQLPAGEDREHMRRRFEETFQLGQGIDPQLPPL
uniref:Fe2OG dioxygenase domain-containing protein n=1 Tax=Macrostomum lignano TaxID=282301 RepID=A0A1I8HP44_9PLAT